MCVGEVVGSCYRVHRAQLGAVMTWRAGVRRGVEERRQREGGYAYTQLIHLVVQQKLALQNNNVCVC